jgi:hypothetical protein
MFEVDREYAPRLTTVGGGFSVQIRDGLCSRLLEISRSIAYALSLSYTPRNRKNSRLNHKIVSWHYFWGAVREITT